MADAWNRGCGCGWGWGTKMGSRKPNASLVIPPPSRRGHGAMGPPGMAWDEGTTDTAHSRAHCPVLTIFCFPLLRHLPIHAWASRKGATNTARLCRLTLYTVRLGQDTPRAPPSIHHPSQAETGFPELFHRWCSLLTAESSPTHLPSPPQGGTPVNPSPPPRLHPFSSCLATPRQQEPRHTRPTLLLLLSCFSPSRLRLRRPTWPSCLSPGPVRSSP